MMRDMLKLNAEGYCRKCGSSLGISGDCTVCAVNAAYERDERKKNDAIAKATKKWLTERGYHISWDGEFYIVNETGFSRDGDRPTRFKFRERVDAYLKALELASK